MSWSADCGCGWEKQVQSDTTSMREVPVPILSIGPPVDLPRPVLHDIDLHTLRTTSRLAGSLGEPPPDPASLVLIIRAARSRKRRATIRMFLSLHGPSLTTPFGLQGRQLELQLPHRRRTLHWSHSQLRSHPTVVHLASTLLLRAVVSELVLEYAAFATVHKLQKQRKVPSAQYLPLQSLRTIAAFGL